MSGIGTELDEFAEGVTTKTEAEFMDEFLDIGRVFLDGAQTFTEMAKVYQERTDKNPELYTAISRLSDSEFDRAYTSLNRDSNRQIRNDLAQENTDGDLHNRACAYDAQQSSDIKHKKARNSMFDSSCSCDQLFGFSTKVDNIDNNTPGKSIQYQDPAKILKSDDALAKPHRSFWKRILSL